MLRVIRGKKEPEKRAVYTPPLVPRGMKARMKALLRRRDAMLAEEEKAAEREGPDGR